VRLPIGGCSRSRVQYAAHHGAKPLKAQEWKRTVSPLLAAGEGWAHRGKLAYRVPLRWVLVGVLGESSGFAMATYVWAVAMPLFEPHEYLNLSYSNRVGGVDDADVETLMSTVEAAAAAAPAEEEALRRLASLSLKTKNVRVFETVAYSQLLLGDVAAATATLRRAQKIPRSAGESSSVGELHDRMVGVEAMLVDGRAGRQSRCSTDGHRRLQRLYASTERRNPSSESAAITHVRRCRK
jgi:hypothetical protein